FVFGLLVISARFIGFRGLCLGGLARRLGAAFGRALGLGAALRHALIDQRDGFGQGDGVGRFVARDRGVDATGRDVGAVAAVFDGDRAERRMIAERLAV